MSSLRLTKLVQLLIFGAFHSDRYPSAICLRTVFPKATTVVESSRNTQSCQFWHFVLLKFENQLDPIIINTNFNSEHSDKCKFAVNVIQLVTISNLFPLETTIMPALPTLCITRKLKYYTCSDKQWSRQVAQTVKKNTMQDIDMTQVKTSTQFYKSHFYRPRDLSLPRLV